MSGGGVGWRGCKGFRQDLWAFSGHRMRVCVRPKRWVRARGGGGVPVGPKQTHWYSHDWGTFRPGDWEALLAKKKEKEGKPRPSFPLPRREWVKGLLSLPLAGLGCPLASEAEKGQEWPPGVDVFPSTVPNFAPLSQDQRPFPGVCRSSASLNRTQGWAGRPGVFSESSAWGWKSGKNIGRGLPGFSSPRCH